jgi:hypothetical protein
MKAEVARMVQWLARARVLREPNDIALWRDWLLEGLFRQVANLQPASGAAQQVRRWLFVCLEGLFRQVANLQPTSGAAQQVCKQCLLFLCFEGLFFSQPKSHIRSSSAGV